MPASTIVTGMVLSAMPVGDYDKRLVILTKELGKISAFAKGARRPNSAFLACSQPFSFGEFTLYAGRSSYNITAAVISNYFAGLRENLDNLCYGLYFCEFADYLTKEDDDDKDILKLLYQSLRALGETTIEAPLIRAVFELKMMVLNGEAPQVFQCVKCKWNSKEPNSLEERERSSSWNSKEPNSLEERERSSQYPLLGDLAGYRFSAECGGILCEACKGHDKSAFRIGTSTLYTMQYIISKEIENLYTFKVTDEVQYELNRCIKAHLDRYIEHEFKSMGMLRTL